jgi:hypothetical protein
MTLSIVIVFAVLLVWLGFTLNSVDSGGTAILLIVLIGMLVINEAIKSC